jgi:hypothetical protein
MKGPAAGPCRACRICTSCGHHQTAPSLHTNPPALHHRTRTTAAQRSRAPKGPMATLRERTYRRTDDSATSTSGISRNRIQIRCAVCRCFLGTLRSASRIALMNWDRSSQLQPLSIGGIALARALRTSRRCTSNFRDTARIVPDPCSYSRRICSYSSTCNDQKTRKRNMGSRVYYYFSHEGIPATSNRIPPGKDSCWIVTLGCDQIPDNGQLTRLSKEKNIDKHDRFIVIF